MRKCNHKNTRFLAVTDYRGYIEKLYQCEDCGTPIADFGTVEDLQLFRRYQKEIDLMVNEQKLSRIELRNNL